MIHLEPFLAREQTSSLNIKLSQPETDGSRLIQISARCLFGTDVSLSLSFRLRFFHFCECRCSVKNELLDLFSVFIIKLILKCNNNNLDLKKKPHSSTNKSLTREIFQYRNNLQNLSNKNFRISHRFGKNSTMMRNSSIRKAKRQNRPYEKDYF